MYEQIGVYFLSSERTLQIYDGGQDGRIISDATKNIIPIAHFSYRNSLKTSRHIYFYEM